MRSRMVMGMLTGVAAIAATLHFLSPTPPIPAPASFVEEIRSPLPGGASSPPSEVPTQWALMKVIPANWDESLHRTDSFAWNDDRVRAWVESHATVITVDLKTDPDTARALALDDVPALLAFKDYREFDRLPLHQSPRSLLEWFAGLEHGERSIQLVAPRRPHNNDPAEHAAMERRWGRARGLVQSKQYSAAADEYQWLWQNIESTYYCKPTALENDISDLVDSSQEARVKFASLRDAALARLGATKVSYNDVLEFTRLNRALNEAEATMAWYERVRHDPRCRPLLRSAKEDLAGPLMRARRWQEVCDLLDDPLFVLENARSLEDALAQMPDPDGKAASAQPLTHQYHMAELSRMYVALLAAGHESEAREFGEKTRVLLGSPDMTLVMVGLALAAKTPRREHLAWLDADVPTEDRRMLRRAVERALMDRLLAEPLC